MKRILITLIAGMLLIPATFVAQSGYAQASGQKKGDEKKTTATASSTASTETKKAETKTAKKGKKTSKKGKKEDAKKTTS